MRSWNSFDWVLFRGRHMYHCHTQTDLDLINQSLNLSLSLIPNHGHYPIVDWSLRSPETSSLIRLLPATTFTFRLMILFSQMLLKLLSPMTHRFTLWNFCLVYRKMMWCTFLSGLAETGTCLHYFAWVHHWHQSNYRFSRSFLFLKINYYSS